MKSAILKDTRKEIKNTFKRFLSILLVVLLGVGFFAGIKAASPDMKKTIDNYFDEQNVMDIQVISTLGLTQDDINTLKKVEGVENVAGNYSQDVIVTIQDESAVIKLETLTDNINQVKVLEGRLPENEQECVVEERMLNWTGHKIGDTVKIEAEKITDDEGNEKDLLKNSNMTIVGAIESPLYISTERGNTKLGSGKISYYMYVHKDAVNSDIYTTAHIQVKNAKELNCTTKQYEDLIDEVEDKIDEISEVRRQARYDELYDEANKKIQDAEKELKDEKAKAEKELKDAQEKIDQAQQEIEEGREEIASNRRTADEEFAKAEEKIKSAEEELEKGEKTFIEAKEKAQKEINDNKNNIEILKETQTQYKTAQEGLKSVKDSLQELQSQLQMLDPTQDAEKIEEITGKITELSQQEYVLTATIQAIETNLQNEGIEPNTLNSVIQSAEEEIQKAETELQKQEDKINEGKEEIKAQKDNLKTEKTNTYTQLEEAEQTLQNGEEEIAENREKLEKARKEANDKIEEAEEEIEKAKIELEDIEKPEWYILDRNMNMGYASYIQDTDRVAKLADVFPIVFFVVATLMSLTSMTRMVEEERVQIGTLKALGYTKVQIASKYVIYALLATIIGSIIGLAIGFSFLPIVVASMYQMVYELPNVIIEFNVEYAMIGTIAALACTVGATIYSCSKELIQTPANLMRPKAPKMGKRVLLEKIPFIWSKLNFTQKVTARNIFRYKKRFLMTIIGVMGCTALILAGFGLRDSIARMIPTQYGEVFTYNAQITLKDDITTKKINEIAKKLAEEEKIENLTKTRVESIEITNITNTQSIQLIIPENVEELSEFIHLQSRKNRKETYTLNKEGVILTEKLANILNIKKGDTITIKNLDDVEKEVKVEEITENYIMHYMYMSPELYQELYEETAKPNSILISTVEMTEDEENKLGEKILQNKDAISGISFTSSIEGMFSEVMKNMNLVVGILIVSAGLLAFVVLYNLANTNISERIRELATIKVLGFYDKEVYQYVARESTILTIIGIAVGLVAGYLLTMFIIGTCELDITMFTKTVQWISYIYAIVITIIFSIVINILTYFALKKINMIESLKSIE